MQKQTIFYHNNINIEAELACTKDYVSQNVVESHEGRKCVDGRYLPDQATGMIARPGGDCGYVMSLAAVNRKKKLGLSPEQCFNAVYKAVSKNGVFCMHTDHNADPDNHTHKGLIGCGHLVKAATEDLCKAYDVESGEVKRFVEYARNLAEISSSMEIVNLNGKHEERGVLIIKSDKYTINADNPALKRMYFIYDEKRDIAFMKKLVQQVAIEGVTFEDMKRESDIQLQATLYNLAMGLPIYTVEFVDSKPKVTYIGAVQKQYKKARPGLHVPFAEFGRRILPKLQKFLHSN